VAAQEAIKVMTKQYVPVASLFLFDGIAASSLSL
jgi:hypothetical protein